MGYSVTEVNSKELLKNKQTNVVNSLAGKVPGVNVTQGSGAADGVVTITTKKGSEGSVSVNFSSKYTYSSTYATPDIQTKYGRGSYDANGELQTLGVASSWGAVNNGPVYDNVKDFFQGGSIWDNSVSVAGGHKNGNFYLSASRYDQQGVIRETGYDKTTFRFNGEQKYGIVTIGANVSYSVANTDKTLTSQGLYSGGGNGTMTALYGW